MLSRVAESLFWMSRYLERAEDVARIIAVNFQASLDAPSASQELAWEPLIAITGDRGLFNAAFQAYDAESVTAFLTMHPENPNAIRSCIGRARENARAVREQISREMWEQLNRLYHTIATTDVEVITRDPYSFFSEIRNGSHLFQGVTDATMAHSEGWEFIQAGKFLERADKTARILDVKYSALAGHSGGEGAPLASLQWIALLKSCSAFEPYRRSHSQLQAWRVVDFLLLDRTFPRSVGFCLDQTRSALVRISDSPLDRPANTAERLLGRLCADLTYLDIREALADLHVYLDDMQHKLNGVGDAIAQSYFVVNVLPPGTTPLSRYVQAQQQQQ
ncbi:MAG TPA: alpha-E domain-containing protein [Kouleothrix sp.]|uniref:alpha-E domain-containing protein n=1 Tax=Kouleothrix sp. TaxID=2779161 RepID=UPI002CEE800A|nr:alpha-E domain-containing protein [Kouleothrix sp.]HRC74751.1 alpha-E domain-containing protein [Kouleothrix sp.]